MNTETKYCKHCKDYFPLEDPTNLDPHWRKRKDNSAPSGVRYRCIKAHREHNKTYNNTPEKYVNYVYLHVKSRCENPSNYSYKYYKGKFHISKEEFMQWGIPTLKEFMHKHNIIECNASNISIDRINDDLGYITGNLQWVFRHDNIVKGAKKKVKSVEQRNLQGNLVKVWDELLQVKNEGFYPSAVSNCCHGKRVKHKGYQWSFIEK